jgi:hypothetical protein
MLDALIAFLLWTFLVAPFQSDLADRLAHVRAPQTVVAKIGVCANAAVPALAERLASDWQWVATRAVGIWIGHTSADAVLGEVAPECRDALAAARPFLAGRVEA